MNFFFIFQISFMHYFLYVVLDFHAKFSLQNFVVVYISAISASMLMCTTKSSHRKICGIKY